MTTNGTKDEENAVQFFSKTLSLECYGNLGQVQVQKLDPETSSKDEHLEVDFLIPYKTSCLIGEICTSNTDNIRTEYRKFRRWTRIITNADPMLRFSHFDIPSDTQERLKNISEIKGLFIATNVAKEDIELETTPTVSVWYSDDWAYIQELASMIGSWAQYPFIDAFNLSEKSLAGDDGTETRYRPELAPVIRLKNRIASHHIGNADIYIFSARPFDLLKLSKVFRRDAFTDITEAESEFDDNYQRPLIENKLNEMSEIIQDSSFVFPNSIIAVLSDNCEYNPERKSLLLDDSYGALSIIDGQHRLFSYAHPDVPDDVRQTAQILVTGIQFHEENEDEQRKFAAKTFIEINKNHTVINQAHIYLVEYDILKRRTGTAIAAKIILECNKGTSVLRGLFKTNQHKDAPFKIVTIIRDSLQHIVNLERIKNATDNRKIGYLRLFAEEDEIPDELTLEEIARGEEIWKRGSMVMERYFDYVSKVFQEDWLNGKSAMTYAKYIAAFTLILNNFIDEGKNWDQVYDALAALHDNVHYLTGRTDGLVFDKESDQIPPYQPQVSKITDFLCENVIKPTPYER